MGVAAVIAAAVIAGGYWYFAPAATQTAAVRGPGGAAGGFAMPVEAKPVRVGTATQDVAAIGINEGSWISSARDSDTSVPYGFFKVLARSGDLPNDMILAGAHVPAEVQALVRDSIVNNKAEIIAAITVHEENGKYLGMDLVPVEDENYDVVRSMYTTAGYPQFDKFLGE